MDSESEWKVIKYKGKKNKFIKERKTCDFASVDASNESPKNMEYHLRVLAAHVKELRCSNFCFSFLYNLCSKSQKSSLKTFPKQIICYGLGSPTGFTDTNITYQLAMLIIIHRFFASFQRMPMDADVSFQIKSFLEKELENSLLISKCDLECLAYDPVFTDQDKILLESCGISISAKNEMGKREANHPTLFYMIHCDRWLYDNLLSENWSSELLSKLTIVGNSFESMFESTPSRIMKTGHQYIYWANKLDFVQELKLPSCNVNPYIFNDTAITSFPLEKCWNMKDILLNNNISTTSK